MLNSEIAISRLRTFTVLAAVSLVLGTWSLEGIIMGNQGKQDADQVVPAEQQSASEAITEQGEEDKGKDKEKEAKAKKDPIAESAAHAIRQGNAKIKEFKKDLKELLIVLTQEAEGGWQVHYKPRNRRTRGGSVTVHVNETGKITKVQRWR